jgi:S-adenosyl-L-methionine hydrolase (adenosine-forming)
VSPAIITLLTDFGSRDAYAGVMKGVILGICPEARLIDLSHSVPPQNVAAGALLLRGAAPYFPAGTIHVAVVDPGVGGRRAAILVQTPRAMFVGPDNGLLHPAATAFGVQRVIELSRSEYHLPEVSRTFHGRDVFAPVAAHLANGVAPDAFGAPRHGLESLDLPLPSPTAEGVRGEVIHVDHFGNLVTNLTRQDLGFPGREVSISIAESAPIPLVGTYGEVEIGELLALIGSGGNLEIAVRDGSAAERLVAAAGAAVQVRSV